MGLPRGMDGQEDPEGVYARRFLVLVLEMDAFTRMSKEVVWRLALMMMSLVTFTWWLEFETVWDFYEVFIFGDVSGG